MPSSNNDTNIKRLGALGAFGAGLFGYFAGSRSQLAATSALSFFKTCELSTLLSVPAKCPIFIDELTKYIGFDDSKGVLSTVANLSAKHGAQISGALPQAANMAGFIAQQEVMLGKTVEMAISSASANSTWLGAIGWFLGKDNKFACTLKAALLGFCLTVALIYSLKAIDNKTKSKKRQLQERKLQQLALEKDALIQEIRELKLGITQGNNLSENDNHLYEGNDSTPDDFLCPIFRTIMRDPVKLEGDTHRFERKAIVSWYNRSIEKVCPLDRQPITKNPAYLPTDYEWKNKISEYIKSLKEEKTLSSKGSSLSAKR